MKVLSTVARILLGIIFVFFGSNMVGLALGHPILHSPMPPGPEGQFLTGLFVTRFVLLVGLCQVIGGLLMLIGQYVTLGLIILGPVIVCIDFLHLSVAPSGLPMAALVTILWILVALAHKHHLAGIFARTA
jgi:putative oxidoreductase